MTDQEKPTGFTPMKVVEKCHYCETPLVLVSDRETFRYTAHDTEACRLTLYAMVRTLKESFKMQQEAILRNVEGYAFRAGKESR